jgi:hypothetical protein
MGGGALLVGGAGTGSAALATAKEIEAGPAFDDLAGLQRRGEALNIGAITLSVVGGFSAAIGTGWFVYWLRERSKPKPNR